MKRGTSGLSLVLGIDKPAGLSSHDVVSRVRRSLAERRVGHAGTLDPLASGVLPVMVGPATRLDRFLTGHDKRYRVHIAFGFSTETDDAEGRPLARGTAPADLFDEDFARSYLASLAGPHLQVPPVYSAIKKDGKKACDQARRGVAVECAPRPIVIHDARLASLHRPDPEEGDVVWVADLHVSKGTYVRSIARDAGEALGCPAHVSQLRRTAVGALDIADCLPLSRLEQGNRACAIDPVPLLGYRLFFADGQLESRISNGNKLRPGDLALYEPAYAGVAQSYDTCTGSIAESHEPPREGERVSAVSRGTLKAVYRYEGAEGLFVPECVFPIGVQRNPDIG